MTWDSRKDPGSRVLGIWLLKPNASFQVDEEPIERVTGGRKYKIVTREYLAQGHDGFSMLTRGQLLIDHDSGAIMSSIVRKYVLGGVNILLMLNNSLNAARFSICQQSHPTERPARYTHSSSREVEGSYKPPEAGAAGGMQACNKCSCSPMGTCTVTGSSSHALPRSYCDLHKRGHDYCRCL